MLQKESEATTNFLTSKINEVKAQSGAIVSQVGSKTETVQVRVAIDNDCSGILRFIIDTGSDWTVIGLHHLSLLHLLPSQLKKPTTEMKVTATVTREKITPEGFVYAKFYFGQSYRVEWSERRAYDQHGLVSKPTHAILLFPWERHFMALSPAW